MEENPDENFGKLSTSDVCNIRKKKKKSTHMSPSIIETVPSNDGIGIDAVDTVSTATHHKKRKKNKKTDKYEKCGEVIDEDIYGNEQVVNSDILVSSMPDERNEPLDHRKFLKKKKKKDKTELDKNKTDDNVELSQEQPTNAQVMDINYVLSEYTAEAQETGQKRKRYKKKHKVHTDKESSKRNTLQKDSTEERFYNRPDFSENADQAEDPHQKRKQHKKKHKIHIDREDSESNVFQEDTQQEYFDDNAKGSQSDDQNTELKKIKDESNFQDVDSEGNNVTSSKQSSNDLKNVNSVCSPKKRKKKKHKHKKMLELQNENGFNEGERCDNGVVERVNNSSAEPDHDVTNQPELLPNLHNQSKVSDHDAPPLDSTTIYKVPDDLDTAEEPVEFDVPFLHSTESIASMMPSMKAALLEKNIEVHKGKFVQTEDDIILKNWKDFIERFGFASPVLLGVGVKSLNEKERKTLVKFIKAKHFYLRLAKGLDQRLLKSVHQRAQKLLYSQKTGITVEAIKKVIQYHELYGDNWSYIAQLMNGFSSGCWSENEEKHLVRAVLTVVDISHVNKLSSGVNKVTWQKVANHVISRKWSSCRKHWLTKVIKKEEEVKKEWSSKRKALLLYMLSTNRKECESDVDWIYLYNKFRGYVSSCTDVMCKWVAVKRKVPGNLKKKTYTEILDYLNHHYMPKLLRKSQLCESDLVKTLEVM